MEKRFVALEIVVEGDSRDIIQGIAEGICKEIFKGAAIVLRTSRPIGDKDYYHWQAVNTMPNGVAVKAGTVQDPRFQTVLSKEIAALEKASLVQKDKK